MTAEDHPATERVKAVVAGEIERIGSWDREYGDDWWQLARDEAQVFGLDFEDMPTLVIVWQAYEEFNKITEEIGIAPALIAQMKAEHPWMTVMKDGTVDEHDFAKFAKLFGVSYRKAYAWFHKNEFWAIRSGITRYNDEQDQ